MTDELETAVPTPESVAERQMEEAGVNPRGRPKKVPTARSIMERDDFKSAVAKAVAEVLKQARAEEGTQGSASDPTWMRALAMEISQLTDQGTGRKRVAPEIIRSRQVSRELMVKLIAKARAAGRTATYRVRAKTLLADRVVEPYWIDNLHTAQPTIIDWDGIPNEAMVPENKTAKEIYEAYKGWIGSTERVVPEDSLAITPGGLVVHGGAASISAGKRRVGLDVPKHWRIRHDSPRRIARQDGCKIEPEAIHMHFLHPVTEAVHNHAPYYGMVGVERVSCTGEVRIA